MQSSYINLRPLVTHTFSLDEAVTALEAAADRSNNAIKIHILDGEQ
jgi:threonine dehydrogenase-like Zn-dependent dehydrogenase